MRGCRQDECYWWFQGFRRGGHHWRICRMAANRSSPKGSRLPWAARRVVKLRCFPTIHDDRDRCHSRVVCACDIHKVRPGPCVCSYLARSRFASGERNGPRPGPDRERLDRRLPTIWLCAATTTMSTRDLISPESIRRLAWSRGCTTRAKMLGTTTLPGTVRRSWGGRLLDGRPSMSSISTFPSESNTVVC